MTDDNIRCSSRAAEPGHDGNLPAMRQAPRGKLFCTNWLADVAGVRDFPFVEVQFKNTRKGFYANPTGLDLKIGDMVAVEASPGHDIGEVTMVGPLVERQMKRANLHSDAEVKKVFRLARQADLVKYEEAKAREHDTMIRSRKIAEDLELNMKIGDVEYQGDGSKAIFYYIADDRVDFRKLIRVLADTFHIRVEMKQIGARQEAGRIGGIGPCGRPLCCASWLTRFVSVGTTAARFQDLSMNPQKLAGQCAKLKCCLNFEVDTYMESQKKLPPKDQTLITQDQEYFFFKADILSRAVTYSTDKKMPVNCVTIPAKRAFEIIALNKNGVKPESLEVSRNAPERKEFVDLVGQDSLTRFDKSKKKKKKKKASRNAEGQAQQKQRNAESQPRQRKQPPQPQDGSAPAEQRPRQRREQQRKPRRRPQGQNDGADRNPQPGSPKQ